jgi:type III pantothenate kinase
MKMTARVLAIDRGNTSTKAALFESGLIVMRYKSGGMPEDIARWAADSRPEGAAVSSVVRSWNGICTDALAGAGIERIHFAGSDSPLPFDLKVRAPEAVGPDRLCAAAAVADAGASNAVVIDAGTAITVDLLNGGAFVGGAIMPGFDMMLGALCEGTHALPLLRRGPSGGFDPPPTPGDDTDSAMLAGVSAALRGGVAELVGLMRDIPAGEVAIYLTGGGAAGLEGCISPPPENRPDLVFEGLNCIYSRKFG